MQPKLLLVDDDEDILLTFAALFKREGFAITTAPSGSVALDHLAAHPVDLVLSDVRMPVIDGIELVERVVGDFRPGPPVILMSGYHDLSEAEALDRGAVRVLTKPIEAKAVVPFMHRIVRAPRERWGTQPAPPPTTTVRLRVEDLEGAQAEGDFGFGRGGIFVRAQDPTLEVGIDVNVEVEAARGVGFTAIAKIIWCRRRENPYFFTGYGLEILAASGSSLEAAVKHAGNPDLKPFIPLGGTPAYFKRL